jgi:protein SCO1/2
MAKLAATRQQLDEGALPKPLQVWFVSVDPVRDTPEQLDQYVDSFDDGILGATGEDAQLRKLTAALGISFRRHGDDPAGDYLVDHSAMLVLIDPEARVRAYFRPPHKPQRLARELEAVLRHARARG